MRRHLHLCVLFATALTMPVIAQEEPASKRVVQKATAASVLILTGEGAGRLNAIGTGAVVSADGIVLTALHVIKNAAEVQVRTSGGDTYDHVQLLGVDERRDVAALRIPARGLPFLEPELVKASQPGDPVFAVTNANGLTWSAVSATVSAVRPADEVRGAGTGYQLIQFDGHAMAGASGGGLLNADGKLIGVITRGISGSVGFAVPVSNVMGLSEASHATQLGSGSFLQTPQQAASPATSSSAAVAGNDPTQLIKNAKTIYLVSKTSFLTIDTLQRALLANKQWPQLGLTIVGDNRLADLVIQVDRPLFTYIHTFVLSDKKTTIVLGSGKQTAFDGTIASTGLAKDIVKILAAARIPAAGK